MVHSILIRWLHLGRKRRHYDISSNIYCHIKSSVTTFVFQMRIETSRENRLLTNSQPHIPYTHHTFYMCVCVKQIMLWFQCFQWIKTTSNIALPDQSGCGNWKHSSVLDFKLLLLEATLTSWTDIGKVSSWKCLYALL